MGKPIKVVSSQEWYTKHMQRIEKGTLLLWHTAIRTFVPVVVISGKENLQVKDISAGAEEGKVYGIYIENVVEMEFPDEIIRKDQSLLNVKVWG